VILSHAHCPHLASSRAKANFTVLARTSLVTLKNKHDHLTSPSPHHINIMAPKYFRHLLFAEDNSNNPSPPMWNRPGNRASIFSFRPSLPTAPMWEPTATPAPIFEESVVSPTTMYARPSTGVPSCPCCVSSPSPTFSLASTASPSASMDIAESWRFAAPRSPPPTPPASFAGRRGSEPSSEDEAARPATAAPAGKKSLRKMQSSVSLRKMPSLGLRIKRSFAQLRGRSSVEE
jgi:hypothetical protein